jgi:hypothetical protein
MTAGIVLVLSGPREEPRRASMLEAGPDGLPPVLADVTRDGNVIARGQRITRREGYGLALSEAAPVTADLLDFIRSTHSEEDLIYVFGYESHSGPGPTRRTVELYRFAPDTGWVEVTAG